MLLYYHPGFLAHQTGDHPECSQRLVEIMERLNATGAVGACRQPTWEMATLERMARVHAPGYIAQLEARCAKGGGRIESDTMVSSKSFAAARLAAGAVCDAVERVVQGSDSQALCLVRPPGHHALHDAPMGFCLFNHIAIGARLAIEEFQLDRVLIVDWDVHHGNGTQDAFWSESRVGFFSIHRWPFYPGTGDVSETGTGKGLGTTLNVPLEMGISRRHYLDAFRGQLEAFAGHIRPQLVLISAGFDAYRLDPVGSLGLEIEDFLATTRIVLDVANAFAGGKVVSVLEGGYNPPALAESVEVHLQEMLKNASSGSI